MKKIFLITLITLILFAAAFAQDPVVGTWRGTHKGDPALGGRVGATRDLHFFPLGTFGANQGNFTLNDEGSTTIFVQGAWNRKKTSEATRKIRVGATEISDTDPNETYLYTHFKVKGAALDKFVAHFVNTWGGPPPIAHTAGKITGEKISSVPTMGVAVESLETASGL